MMWGKWIGYQRLDTGDPVMVSDVSLRGNDQFFKEKLWLGNLKINHALYHKNLKI